MGRIPTPEHEHIEYLEAEITKLSKKLEEARALIQRDRERIQLLNSGIYITSSSYNHTREIRKLEKWIRQLRHDFDGLLSTGRWRLGDLIVSTVKGDFRRNKNAAAQLHASQVLREFELWKQKMNDARRLIRTGYIRKGIPVDQLIIQLENDILALSKSTRYRTGNAVVRLFGLALFRGRPRLAMDHMLEIFRDYHSSREEGGENLQGQIENWIQQLDTVFRSFMASNRWRVGNNLLRGLDTLLLRKRSLMATDHIQALFKDYKQGKYHGGVYEKCNQGLEGTDFRLRIDPEFRNKYLYVNDLSPGHENMKTRDGLSRSINLNRNLHLLNKGAGEERNKGCKKRIITEQLLAEPGKDNLIPKLADQAIVTKRTPTADIVVCVHNALGDVKTCLESVKYKTSHPYRLIVVNDGSDQKTSGFLNRFALSLPGTILIHNRIARGYTKAANQGLRASSADYNILLNSDTIVTTQWLERIVECGESDTGIGVIGPLSNAASYQSIPELWNENKDWAVNQLPEGITPDLVANEVYIQSGKDFPRVPFINGFCYVIKKLVLEKAGYFDEVNFPVGYGEENDYSLRARDADFDLVIADHVYIHHNKSKSFGHERRRELAAYGQLALESKHGKNVISEGIELWESVKPLEDMRRKMTAFFFDEDRPSQLASNIKPRLLWLMEGSGGDGGALSIVQEASCLGELGWVSHIAVNVRYEKELLVNYSHRDCSVFIFYKDKEELHRIVSSFNIAIGTIFTTIKELERLCEVNPNLIPAYYIQDYEPWIIHPKDKKYYELVEEAFLSYTRIKNIVCFAKTDWIKETVQKYHPDVKVNKVTPGFDKEIFSLNNKNSQKMDQSKVKIVAMIRPSTPRRAPKNTMVVLRNIKNKFPGEVDVTIFGCRSDEPGFLSLPRDFAFDNKGLLTTPQVSTLLASADIFLDMSKYQAFGRTGLEAMSQGCSVVLPVTGGTHEYAEHGENCLLVDTSDLKITENALVKLIFDHRLRSKLIKEGIVTASRYSILTAALSEGNVLKAAFSGYNNDA
jgi:GT2 family glycosyltransferase/glycosyltransferase involved in cell wall biosynthesis